jgi:hypothetical protein
MYRKKSLRRRAEPGAKELTPSSYLYPVKEIIAK